MLPENSPPDVYQKRVSRYSRMKETKMVTKLEKTACGRLLRVGNLVKVKSRDFQLPGCFLGKVIERRQRKTGFVTHIADSLGAVWVKFGKRKDNTEKIVAISPRILAFVPKPPTKKRESVDLGSIGDSLDLNLDLESIEL